MTTTKLPKRLGFFTRVLDQADAAERYRLATEQIIHAERCGCHHRQRRPGREHEAAWHVPGPELRVEQVQRLHPHERVEPAQQQVGDPLRATTPLPRRPWRPI